MLNPVNDKSDKSPEELEHLHDVTSEQANMDTTPLALSPSPTPTVQGGKKIANPGASSSSKGQLLGFCSGPHSCRICGGLFRSQNAVNGHMRMHKQPKEKGRECEGGGAGSDANRWDTLQEELSSSFRPDGLVIDLNQSNPCSLHEEESGRFDLNKPPPTEDEDGSDGKNINASGRPIN